MSEIEINVGGEDNGLVENLLAVEAALVSVDATLRSIDETIAKTGEQLEQLADDADETGETFDEAGESGEGFSLKIVAVEAAVNLAGKAIDALLSAGGRLIDWSEASREAFDEQDEVNRRLYSTLLRSGEAAESFAEKQAILAQVSNETGIGDEALSAGLEKYIKLTGDAKGSAEDLALITDIMAGADKDATAAAELLAKAQNGKLEGLEDVLPLTKDEIDALNKIEDGNKRSAIAVDLLTQQYGGQAKQVAASTLAKNNLTNASGDLLQMVGSLIDASGVYTAVLDPMTEGLRDGEAALADNSVQAQHLLINGVLKLVDGSLALNTVMLDNAEFVGGATVSAELLGKTFLILIDTVQLIGRAIGSLLSGSLAALISGFEEAALLGADLARAAGQEGLASDLEFGARAAGHLSDELEQVAKSNLDGAIEDAKEMDATFGSMADTIAKTDERIDLARKTLTKTGEVIEKMKANLAEAGENVEALDPTRSARRGGDVDPVDKSAAEDAAAKEKAKRAQELADKRELRDIDMQLIGLRTELVKAQEDESVVAQIDLTYRIAALEAERAAVGAADEKLAEAQKSLDLLEAQAEARASIVDAIEREDKEAEAARQKEKKDADALAEAERKATIQAAEREAIKRRIAAARTDDETQASLLEIQAQRLIVQASIADETERQYELLKLTLEEEQLVAEARAEALALRLDATEQITATLSDLSAVNAILEEQVTATVEKQADAALSAEERVRAQADAVRDQAAAYGELIGRLGQTAVAFQQAAASEDLLKDGAEATASAIGAAASVAGGIADIFVEGARERAAVESAINAAASVAAFGAYAASVFTAQPFAVASANHAAAAIQYGVIAGTTPSLPSGGGGGGGGSVSTGGGAAASGGGFAGFDFDRERAAQAEAIASAIAETNQSNAGTQVIVDARGMRVFSDDPDDVRRMAEELVDPIRELL